MGTPTPQSPSQLIGRYAIHEEIASGGMATVHFGRLVGAGGFSRTVAIKRLHAQYETEPSVRAMFVTEAHLASRIHHPNVVAAVDIVSVNGQLLLVMDYVPGESLSRLLQITCGAAAGRVPQKIALAIVTDMLHGLHAAHEAKSDFGEPLEIVHCDVSPHNILVGTDGIARVIDFGIARAATHTETTHEGVVKGKLAYISPEQLVGADITRRADVFSASVVLWELLTGKRLFYKEDAQALMIDKMVRGTVERPSHAASGISRILDAITLHGLERDPAKRFQTAGEMAQTIEKFASIATPAEVASWVQETAHEALTTRARQVAIVEQRSAKPVVSDAVRASRASLQLSTPMEGSISLSDPREVTERARETSAPPLSKLSKLSRNRRLAFASLASLAGTIMMALVAHEIGSAPIREEPRPTSAALATVAAKPACPGGMVQVPGGKFFMGSDDEGPSAKPVHSVSVAPYCIDTLEVTAEDYKACSDKGDCKRARQNNDWDGITEGERRNFDPLCNARPADDHGKRPINCVEWELARAYCGAHAARLPTEAEWELAARGRYGLGDMSGIVGEWVGDFYAPYTRDSLVDPHGPAAGKERVIRGGTASGGQTSAARPTLRFKDAPEKRSYGIGFRCARSL